MPRATALIPIVLCGMLNACYTYRAAPSGQLVTGSSVRLRINAEGAAALLPTAGMSLRSVEGVLQTVESDGALTVLPSDVTTVDGDALSWRRGVLSIPTRALEGTEQRTISKRRSVGVAAGIAGVFTGVVVYAFRSIWGGSGSSVSPGPGTPE